MLHQVDKVVYTHDIDKGNGRCVPFYVGKGDLKRAQCLRRNLHHSRVLRKYGQDNARVTIWYSDLSENEALKREKELIAFLKTEDVTLSNYTMGGEGTVGYRHSPEECFRRIAANSGENNPMHGKQHTDAARKAIGTASKISGAQKKGWTEERKKAYSDRVKQWCMNNKHPMLGKKHTDVTRKLLSLAHIGKVHSEATKKKISMAFSKMVWVTDGTTVRRVPSAEVHQVELIGWRRGRK